MCKQILCCLVLLVALSSSGDWYAGDTVVFNQAERYLSLRTVHPADQEPTHTRLARWVTAHKPFKARVFSNGRIGVDALKGHCNKEEDLLQRCSMALPVLSSPEISFALTREELDKSCVELRAGIRCIDNYTEVCMEKHEQVVFRRIYAGITDVVQELCTRGSYQDEYLRHADCVKNVRSEYEVCSKRYEVTLTTLSNHQKSDQYQTDQHDPAASHEDYLRTVCCSFQEYLLCSERTVQRSCGDEAAQFTSHFLKRMASNIIKNFCLEYRGQECGTPGSAHYNQGSFLATLVLLGHILLYLVPT